MPVAGGGGRWGQVFMFFEYCCKRFWFLSVYEFFTYGLGGLSLSKRYIGEVSIKAWVCLCRGVGFTHGAL